MKFRHIVSKGQKLKVRKFQALSPHPPCTIGLKNTCKLAYFFTTNERLQRFFQNITHYISKILHCMKIRIFAIRKFVKRTEKIIFSLVFICFRFMEISYFLNFPSNKNVRKQHLSANTYSCVNMKFSYTKAVRKDEIFYVVLL